MRKLILWCGKRRLGLMALGLTLLFCLAAVPPMMHEDREVMTCSHCGALLGREYDFYGNLSRESVLEASLSRWSAEHEQHKRHDWKFVSRTQRGIMGTAFACGVEPPISSVSKVLSGDGVSFLTDRLGEKPLRDLLNEVRGGDLQQSQAAIRQIRTMIFDHVTEEFEQAGNRVR